MRVFTTYLYEVQKGTKPVALITCDKKLCTLAVLKLKKAGVSFLVRRVSGGKFNLFFGDKNCIDVLKKLIVKPLNELNPLEDYILGTILGYDIKLQCERFLKLAGAG